MTTPYAGARTCFSTLEHNFPEGLILHSTMQSGSSPRVRIDPLDAANPETDITMPRTPETANRNDHVEFHPAHDDNTFEVIVKDSSVPGGGVMAHFGSFAWSQWTRPRRTVSFHPSRLSCQCGALLATPNMPTAPGDGESVVEQEGDVSYQETRRCLTGEIDSNRLRQLLRVT